MAFTDLVVTLDSGTSPCDCANTMLAAKQNAAQMRIIFVETLMGFSRRTQQSAPVILVGALSDCHCKNCQQRTNRAWDSRDEGGQRELGSPDDCIGFTGTFYSLREAIFCPIRLVNTVNHDPFLKMDDPSPHPDAGTGAEY